MLDELGGVLATFLRDRLPAGTPVRAEAPCHEWTGAGPVVGLFLHRVRPSRSTGSDGLWTEDRDAAGHVVRRSGPEQRYDFGYLLTAWASELQQELALLGTVLRLVANNPVVPAAHLPKVLAARAPVTLDLDPPANWTTGSALWPSLGLPPRACLDLVVTASVPPPPPAALAPAPTTVDLGVTNGSGSGGRSDGPSSGGRSDGPGSGGRADRTTTSEPGGPARRRPLARVTEGGSGGTARGEAG